MSATSYITIDRVLERVHDEYGLPNIHKHQAMEWVVDTLLLIGSNKLLIDEEKDVQIVGGRASLPLGFYEINPAGVREKDTGVYLLPRKGSFKVSEETPEQSYTIVIENGVTVVYDFQGNPLDPAQLPTSVISIIRPELDRERYEYFIKDGWIFTGIHNTILELSYTKIPIDKGTGELLIPEDVKIINAAVTNVAHKLAKRLFIKGQLAERVYNLIADDYYFAIASARSGSKVPSISEMEAIKNRYLTLLPVINHHDSGFRDSNLPEQLNR